MGAQAAACAQLCGPSIFSSKVKDTASLGSSKVKVTASLSSETGRQRRLLLSPSLSSLKASRQVFLGCQFRSTSLRNSVPWYCGGYGGTDIVVDKRKKKYGSHVSAEFRSSSSEYAVEAFETPGAASSTKQDDDAVPSTAPSSVSASANGSAAADVVPKLDSHPVVLGAMTEYVIRVNVEMMGVLKYVEKLKRARIKDLADALIQVALACTLFTCVRGLLIPLIEIFSSHPPNWSKAVLMLAGLDYFAVAYLAFKAREPMMQAIQFAVVPSEGLEALERQEEVMVTMLVELVKLFKRMRNVLLVIAFTQAAQAMYGMYAIKDPNFVGNVTAAIKTWVIAPWN